MTTATLHQIGETLLIEVPRELAKARHLKPGAQVSFDVQPQPSETQGCNTDDSKLAELNPEARRQLLLSREVMREHAGVLHALAQ